MLERIAAFWAAVRHQWRVEATRPVTVTRSEQCYVCHGLGWVVSRHDLDAVSCPVCENSGFAQVTRTLADVLNEQP